MGDLIVLDKRRTRRRHSGGARHESAPLGARRPATAAFYFDVGCPFSYLAAERVERALGTVAWIPASSAGLDGGGPWSQPQAAAAARDRAEQRARELRIPLVWPERFPAPVPIALRAAASAAECGSGMAFALAAARLAYCGGYDLEDPETLTEAAAAAGMKLDDCLAAAGAASRDRDLLATARGLRSCGVNRLPAVRVGDRFFAGERRLPAAAAVLCTTGPARRVAPLS
jgi:2-hydroxychromene-2-carboxylate isomerase